MDDTRLVAEVQARYKALGLTQETLAWLAGVSRSTVRNALAGRIAPTRTWPRIETALGWTEDSLPRIDDGVGPGEVIPVDALRGAITALHRLADQNPELADQARQTWTSAFTGMRASDTPERVSDIVLLSSLDNAWALLAGSLTPTESALLTEAFEDFGWRIPRTRPQAQTASTESSAASQSGFESDDLTTNHFDRTPASERAGDPLGNRPDEHWFTLALPFPANPDIRLGFCLVRNSAAPRPTVTIEELNLLQTIYHRVQEMLAPPDQANDTDISPGPPQ